MTHVYEGVLPIHKPAGYTSHDIVAIVRRMLQERRIGHTGTLDPEVTGVLTLCVGRATRLVEILQELPKMYEAELTFGYATDTEDASGQITSQVEHVEITESQVEKELQRFIGPIEQIPPMYSAVKQDGKRLYELARKGLEVERKPRSVLIHNLDLLEFIPDSSRPRIRFRVRCSKGTYIRTLCVDIGKALGYPSVMSQLIRTETSGITLDVCYRLDELSALKETGKLQHIFIPTDQAIQHLPAITIDSESAFKAMNGQTLTDLIEIPSPADASESPFQVRVYDSANRFIGVFYYDLSKHQLIPDKIFMSGNSAK